MSIEYQSGVCRYIKWWGFFLVNGLRKSACCIRVQLTPSELLSTAGPNRDSKTIIIHIDFNSIKTSDHREIPSCRLSGTSWPWRRNVVGVTSDDCYLRKEVNVPPDLCPLPCVTAGQSVKTASKRPDINSSEHSIYSWLIKGKVTMLLCLKSNKSAVYLNLCNRFMHSTIKVDFKPCVCFLCGLASLLAIWNQLVSIEGRPGRALIRFRRNTQTRTAQSCSFAQFLPTLHVVCPMLFTVMYHIVPFRKYE